MNVGLIGNCQYSALIDTAGRVVWLCWPRFDASFVFGGLLDADKGGVFEVACADRFHATQSYVENTNVLRTVFRSARGAFEVIDFAPRFVQYDRYFRPTMLVREIRPLSGRPVARVRCEPVYDYGLARPRVQWGSNHIEYTGLAGPLRLTTNMSLTYLTEGRPFVLKDRVYLVLTWGQPLEAPLETTCEDFLRRTVSYWRTWVRRCAIPAEYQKEVIRSALALKIHQFDDTGAIVAATTTSLPEAPGTGRTWDYRFCWLRDAFFTLDALRLLSHADEMERFVTYLYNVAAGARGRLQPVYGLSGETDLVERELPHLAGYRGEGPVRVGNAAHAHVQNDVYGEMILAISPLFLDARMAGSALAQPWDLLTRLLADVARHLAEKDAGIWEFRDKRQLHTFSLLMSWAGVNQAARIASRLGRAGIARRAERLAARARGLIRRHAWRPRAGAFAEAAGGTEWDASLLLMLQLGFLDARAPAARSHVLRLGRALRAANGFIHRYTHDDDFGRSVAVFTSANFWHAEALARIGRRDAARALFERILARANHVGLLSEDLDPKTGEQWGNFPQTYSHVGLIHAAFALSRPW